MSIAVVFAARQHNGYNLCEELLEKGYTVYAIDHSLWQNDSHEEKWLFIGRNANLHYFEVDKEIIELRDDEKKVSLCFVPIIDYYLRNFPKVNKSFINDLKRFSMDCNKELTFVFIQPSAIHLEQSRFYLQHESLLRDIKKTNKVREYFLPYPTNDHFFSYTSHNESLKRRGSSKENILKDIIQDIEETNKNRD